MGEAVRSENVNFIKGLELVEQKKFSSAIDHFTRAIESEENPHIYYERALTHFYLNNYLSALQDMDKARDLDPDNPFRYASRAFIKDKAGDLDGAMNDYKKAIELDPEDAISYNNLGLLEEKAGFAEMARQHYKKADQLPFPSTGIQEAASQTLHKNPKKNLNPGVFELIFQVFRRKSVFLEFIRFIRNGGKIKEA